MLPLSMHAQCRLTDIGRAHARSMGGILIKEMLAKSAAAGAPVHHRRLRDATAGLVFFATPHHGSWLADVGWNLRFLGASPASSVVHLKPGSHLEVRPLVSIETVDPV